MLAGVDGCRGGWVVAVAEDWPPRNLNIFRVENIQEVIEKTKDFKAVCIDMPIGLDKVRQCDVIARKLLQRGASRVFSAPIRESLVTESYPEFLEVHKKVMGKGISKQAWNITKKIIEVDNIMTPELQEVYLEFHPEISWLKFTGRVLTSKHKSEGIQERINAIPFDMDYESKRKELKVNLDDILDAIIGIASAKGSLESKNNRIPNILQYDPKGLRMEMWFPSVKPITLFG